MGGNRDEHIVEVPIAKRAPRLGVSWAGPLVAPEALLAYIERTLFKHPDRPFA
jgi:hypothetical protein